MERQTTIKKLFHEEGIQFAIPSYQRAYSWEVEKDRKQVEQFLTDIKDQNPKKKYFLGHFLFEKDEQKEYKYWVIDGQQRLTTVIIFMSCIIKELKKREEKQEIIKDNEGEKVEVWRIEENYIKLGKRYKFETVTYDNPFFESTVFDNNEKVSAITSSAKRISAAKNAFEKAIVETKTSELLNWKKIIDDAVITTFEVTDKVQATQIFAFQNDRGKDLTTLEKLKAFLMHKIYAVSENDSPDDLIKNIETIFSDIYKQSERITFNEDQVLGFHNTAFLSGWEQPLKNVKDELQKVVDKEKWIKDFVSNLKETFVSIEIIEKHSEQNCAIADALILDTPSTMPLLIKLFHFHKTNINGEFVADINLIDTLIRQVEHILFRLEYTFGNYRSNSLYWKAKTYNGDAEQLKKDLQHWKQYGFQPYWNFVGDCKNYFYGTYHYHNNIRYILWKYENHLRANNRTRLISPQDFKNKFGTKNLENTTDHITPRDPNFTTYSEDFKRDWLNNIGNLVIMVWGDNSSKRNHNPKDKISLFDSDFYSHKEIRDILNEKEVWSAEEIEKRRDEIVKEFIEKNWELN